MTLHTYISSWNHYFGNRFQSEILPILWTHEKAAVAAARSAAEVPLVLVDTNSGSRVGGEQLPLNPSGSDVPAT